MLRHKKTAPARETGWSHFVTSDFIFLLKADDSLHENHPLSACLSPINDVSQPHHFFVLIFLTLLHFEYPFPSE